MISLATFRFVGRHAINLLSGMYIAAALAHVIGKLMPSAQTWTFIFLCVLWILTELAVIIRELNGGRRTSHRPLRTSSWLLNNHCRVGTYFLGRRLLADDAQRLSSEKAGGRSCEKALGIH